MKKSHFGNVYLITNQGYVFHSANHGPDRADLPCRFRQNAAQQFPLFEGAENLDIMPCCVLTSMFCKKQHRLKRSKITKIYATPG
jgi:hypothetical protein